MRGIHNTDDQLNEPSYIKKDMKHTNSKTQQITVNMIWKHLYQ